MDYTGRGARRLDGRLMALAEALDTVRHMCHGTRNTHTCQPNVGHEKGGQPLARRARIIGTYSVYNAFLWYILCRMYDTISVITTDITGDHRRLQQPGQNVLEKFRGQSIYQLQNL